MSTEVLKHYNQESSFFRAFLDKKMKYTSGLFLKDSDDLQQSIDNMLDLHLQLGEITERSRILDVGCGWGATALHLREKGHSCHYTGVTPSRVQIEFIQGLNLLNCNLVEGFFDGIKPNISDQKFDL